VAYSDFAQTTVRLKPAFHEPERLVAHLNASGGLVSAALEGDDVVIRPKAPPTVAGLPAYYSARPHFRGRLSAASPDDVFLRGFVRHSIGALVFTVAGGLFTVLGMALGVSVVVFSGDSTGGIIILVSLVSALALGLQTLINWRLAKADEARILSALEAVGIELRHLESRALPPGVSRLG
jgi:hypothetical protein